MKFHVRNSIIHGTLILMTGLLIISGQARACGPVYWDTCECEAAQYTITPLVIGGTGTITFSPSQPSYTRGEYVSIVYNTAPGERFLFWTIDPPSNLASLSTVASSAIYVTEDTVVSPWVISNVHTVTVKWDLYDEGTVTIPGNAQNITATSFQLTGITWGATVNLSASPDSGYYTKWHHDSYSHRAMKTISISRSTAVPRSRRISFHRVRHPLNIP
jgi:hypothetical protein